MAVSWLSRLAARGPAPVYVATGSRCASQVQDLALDPRLHLVDSPRQARVLLVAGGISPSLTQALRQLHDQVPSPMVSVWWQSTPPAELAASAVLVRDRHQIAETVADAYRALLHGEKSGDPHLCLDEPPNPWEGLGDHDQGGEGMMGGTPYGRSMAMTSDDIRDGLQLDPLSFTFGPFWPALPPGLCAHVTLHGDVVAQFEISHPPYPIAMPSVFLEALKRPVPIAELEMARARYHLRQLSRALWLSGLNAQSLALLQKLQTLEPGHSLTGFRNQLRRTGFFASAGAHKGLLSRDQATSLKGPAARAAGVAADARTEDPNYQKISFKVILNHGGDCHARWHQWLDEAQLAIDLATQASKQNLLTSRTDVIETPRGPMGCNKAPGDSASVLEELLPGLEWSEALATLVSLDLAAASEYEEAASA